METLPILLVKVLQILAERYGTSCTLEELTRLLSPVLKGSALSKNSAGTEKENQARILDALIHLDDQGYVFLNSDSDKSCITLKGLILVQNRVFCN